MVSRGQATTLKLQHFEPAAKAWISAAQTLADQRGHVMIEPIHALAQGLAEPGVARVLAASGVEVRVLRERLEAALSSLPRGREPAYLSDATLDLLRRTDRLAEQNASRRVRRQDLLLAL